MVTTWGIVCVCVCARGSGSSNEVRVQMRLFYYFTSIRGRKHFAKDDDVQKKKCVVSRQALRGRLARLHLPHSHHQTAFVSR